MSWAHWLPSSRQTLTSCVENVVVESVNRFDELVRVDRLGVRTLFRPRPQRSANAVALRSRMHLRQTANDLGLRAVVVLVERAEAAAWPIRDPRFGRPLR